MFVFTGVPTFFRACCYEASKQEADYSHPGASLYGAVESLIPFEAGLSEWGREVEVLNAAIDGKEPAAVLDWFVKRYPLCMAMIPRRRRAKFVEGVFAERLQKEWGYCYGESHEIASGIVRGGALCG